MFSAMSDSLLNHGAKIVQTEWNVKRETRFSFHSRGAAYLGRQCKGTKKNNRFTHLSPTCDHFSHGMLHFPVYQLVTKSKNWSINLGDYRILLNIRQIGGALYNYWLETVVRSWV